MNNVTVDQAKETYLRTVKDEPRENWADWINAVFESLTAGRWVGGIDHPAFAESVFNVLTVEKRISMSDCD